MVCPTAVMTSAAGCPSMKVTYSCGLKSYNEWVCVEHQGYARQKALEWWRKRAPGCPMPRTVDDAIAQAGTTDPANRDLGTPVGPLS